MKNSILILFLLSIISLGKDDTKNELSEKFIAEQLEFCAAQYKLMAEDCADSLFPRSYENGKFITSKSDWWCSGFFPGSLVYLYEFSSEQYFKDQILNRFKYLEKEKYNTSDHDIGFKIYCSFGNMLRATKDTTTYKQIILDAANSLLKRYNPKLGVIRSWDNWEPDWQYVVIIDNMMNLELLIEATNLSGDSTFVKAAISHADKTIENHFRDDGSSYHVVSYDTLTGKPHLKETRQGFSDESAWARGQAWGLYGFTTMYNLTGKQRYLDKANEIAKFILNNTNLPKDLIPYWDYNSDKIPNTL
ncbi:MAG: glycoside hydrolase family 88 protein, partial [Ignavibacteriae bacterium]|nr:glycoside hydrolase family 88 protein [Ignavibacteriota bacterium]